MEGECGNTRGKGQAGRCQMTGKKIRPPKAFWVVLRTLVFVASTVGSHRKARRRGGQMAASRAL